MGLPMFHVMVSLLGCFFVGLCWGLLNYVQKVVSLKTEDKRKNMKLSGLFILDKLSSIIYVASI